MFSLSFCYNIHKRNIKRQWVEFLQWTDYAVIFCW
jgi:hypothetical protein